MPGILSVKHKKATLEHLLYFKNGFKKSKFQMMSILSVKYKNHFTYFANNRLHRQLFPIISPSVFLIRILVPFLFPLSISSILVLIVSISIFISVLLLVSISVLISVFFFPASTSVPFSTPTSTVRSISVFLLSIFSVP